MMEHRQPRRPFGVWVLVGLLVVQGLSGVAGGFGLVRDPSGEALGIPVDWLAGSPFSDYRIPGVVLLVLLGLVPLGVARAVWTERRGAVVAAGGVGVALIVWIGVQIGIVGYQADPPLQAIYGALGVAIVAATLRPSVRRGVRGEASGS